MQNNNIESASLAIKTRGKTEDNLRFTVRGILLIYTYIYILIIDNICHIGIYLYIYIYI